MKVMTLRIPNETYEALREIARVEVKSVALVIREAIDAHIERRRRDPAFQLLLREEIARTEAVYRRLSDGMA